MNESRKYIFNGEIFLILSLKLAFLELYNNIILVFCKYLVKMLKC